MPNPPRYTRRINGAYIQPAPPRERAERQQVSVRQSDYLATISSWLQQQSYIRYYLPNIPEPTQEEQPMFNIGDSVYYYSEMKTHKFYGIVKKINGNSIQVLFEEDFTIHYNYNPLYTIKAHSLQLGHKEPPLPIEQQVSNKCKKLWNNSNYVKKNPQYAY